MLNRTISDIYHLKKVHAIMPDHNLGATLADKIQRLNLKPALATLAFVRTAEAREACLLGRPASSSTAAVTSRQPPQVAQPQQLIFTTAEAALVGKQVLPDPSCLCQLLECLAYFELGRSDVTQDALMLVRACLPAMSAATLARTLAAVCALGQQASAVSALPLLTAALRRVGERPAVSPRTASPSVYMEDGERGVDVIQLMEALQAAEVHQEEVWAQIAEHCVRHMDSFDGKELFRVVELFYLEDMRYYPDFFVAAEGFLSAQPYTFLSSEHRHQLVGYYKELGQPVVSLLAASTSGVTDSFDAALAALPAARSNRSAATRAATLLNAEGEEPPTAAAAGPSTAMDGFVETACKAISKADEQALMELLRKCELKDAMDPTVMDAAATRLAELCLSPLSEDAPPAEGGVGKHPAPRPKLQMDIFTVTHLLRHLFAFKDPHYFQSLPRTAVVLSAVLDALAEHSFHELHTRLLPVAVGAVTLLPPPPPLPLSPPSSSPASASSSSSSAPRYPAAFFRAVVRYLQDARDTLASEGPHRLLTIATILQGLPHLHGHAVLQEYVPFIALAAPNASMRVQVELAALLATVPSARQEVLPALFKSVTGQKGWGRRMQPAEAKRLLEAMVRSRAQDAALLTGIMELVQQRRQSLEPSDLVWFMHSLARLGVRDLEFFSSTAEYLLGAVSPVTRTRTSVHDLCETLYIFTFIIKGVIRVVQQVIARLKVSAGQATPRDITLTFFSFVKLQVARHHDVAWLFCDRAVSIFATFKGEELASMLGSLRALGYCHEGVMKAAAALLIRETSARHQLTDVQYVSVVVALQSLVHTSVARRMGQSRRANRPHGPSAGDSAGAPVAVVVPPASHESVAESTGQALARLFREAATAAAPSFGEREGAVCGQSANDAVAYAAVCAEFRRVSVRLVLAASAATAAAASPAARLPQRLSGMQLHGLLTTLAAMRAQLYPPLSSAEWALLAVEADARPEQIRRGYDDVEGAAAAEVLTALKDLEATVVPALPSEEGGPWEAYTATVDRWAAAARSTGALSLASIPPRLAAVVQQHIGTVVANVEAREGLKRCGLLSSLTAAVGGQSGFDLHGATLTGEGGGMKKRRRGGGRSTAAPRLTSERVMAAMDAEHQRAAERGASGRATRTTGLFAPLSVSPSAAPIPEAEWSPDEVVGEEGEDRGEPSSAVAATAPKPASAHKRVKTGAKRSKKGAAAK